MDNAFERTPQAETQIPRSLLGVIPDRAGTIKSGPSCSGERPKSCNLIENRQVVEACFGRQSVRVAGWYGNDDVARRAMERTRHSICWTRSFTRAWTLGTWRCRAAEGPSRAVNAQSCRLACPAAVSISASITAPGDQIDKLPGIHWGQITPPGDVLIRPRQHQGAIIDTGAFA
jgi:hypothetical protein